MASAAYNRQTLAPPTFESAAGPCSMMASPPACTSATPVNGMHYQNTPPSDAGQPLHAYGPSGEPNSAAYLSPFVLTGHATQPSYEGMAAVPVAYSSVEAAGPPCPVLPMCSTMASHSSATGPCGGMAAPPTQPFIATTSASGGHYEASAVTGCPMVVPIQCVGSGYGLSPYDAPAPSNPVCTAAASAPICEPYSEAPHAQWTREQLVFQLEALLNREALSERRDTIIDNLVRSSPDFKLSAEALASHPLLVPATPSEILKAASVSSILEAEFDTRMVVPELRAKRLTLILRDVAPSVTAYHITSLMCQNSAIVPAEEKQAVLDFAAHHQATDAAAKGPSVATTDDTPNVATTPTSINFRGVSSFLTSLRFMGASSWFLALNDERLVEDLAWWLRGQMLQGAPVQVRIKTESPLRRGPLEFLAPGGSFTASTHIQVHQHTKESTATKTQGKAEGGAPAVNERATNGRAPYRRRGVMGKQRSGARHEKTTDPRPQPQTEHSDPKKPPRNLTAIIGTPDGGAPRQRARFFQKHNAALDLAQAEGKRSLASSQNYQQRSPGITPGGGRFTSRNHIKPAGALTSSSSKAEQASSFSHPLSEMDHTRRPAQATKKGGSYTQGSDSGAHRNGYTKRHPATQHYKKTPQGGRQPRAEAMQKVVTPHDTSTPLQTESTIMIGAQDFPPLCATGYFSANPTLKPPNNITSATAEGEQSVSSAKKVDDNSSTPETMVEPSRVSSYSSSVGNAPHVSGKNSEDFSSSPEREQEVASGSETNQRKGSTSATTTTGSVTSTRNDTTDSTTTPVSHDAASRLFWASCQKKLQIILKQDEYDAHSTSPVASSFSEGTEEASTVIQKPTNQPASVAVETSVNGKSFRQEHISRAPGQDAKAQQARCGSPNDGSALSSQSDSNTAKNGSSAPVLEGHGRRQHRNHAGPKQLKTGPAKAPQQQDGVTVQQRRRGSSKQKVNPDDLFQTHNRKLTS